jgi:putative ABC transport system permease protein
MLRSYFIVAFRTFSRQKAYSLLNISGLAIGLAGAFLIYTYIIDELRYDTIHPFHKNTYRLGTHYIPEDGDERKFSSAPALWSGQLKEQFPGVKSILRSIWVGFPYSIHYKDKDRIILTEELFLVDNSFREVLYFDVIAGNRETALQDVNSIALSESTAKKIFGSEDPIGKILSVKHVYGTEGQELNLAVTAQPTQVTNPPTWFPWGL